LVLISRIQTFVASAVFALAMATAANAATVTYINADPTPVMELTVDDNGGSDLWTFSLETTVGMTDYLAFTLYGDGNAQVSDCEQGCNFNGSGSASLFDYIIKFASQGGSADNYVKTVQFTIALAGATWDFFTQFGIRAQSTSNLEQSIKADLTIPPVPQPAGLPLLLSGLLAAGLLVRRRTV
jgi:hypothetical protein